MLEVYFFILFSEMLSVVEGRGIYVFLVLFVWRGVFIRLGWEEGEGEV